MVARIASFEGLDVQAARNTFAAGEAIIQPVLAGLDGFQSSLALLSDDGRMLSITIFETDANAEAAEATLDQRLPELLGDLFADWAGRRVSVDHYQVLAR